MAVWVRLLVNHMHEENGTSRRIFPGDWIEVGKQTAQRMVNDGVAEYAKPQASDQDFSDCTVLVFGEQAGLGSLEDRMPSLTVQFADAFSLPTAKTLLWDPRSPLRPERVAVGMKLLDTWEVVAPIHDYDKLACHVGTPEDRQATADLIGDLRVPLYDPHVVFLRKSRATQALIDAWQEESASLGDDRLALLRAIWRVKPLLLPVPTTWVA